jgi:methionyl-tRNA synthetase
MVLNQNSTDEPEDFEIVQPCRKCGYQVVQGDQCGNCGKAN